ncbi:MAG: PTS sugar transporter subunit IIA [Lachnospiraceae bacterium]|jgi:mannose/fructose-specific phosphotransferase system component IIA|nr:PTS sugar transporter subunit IIA [Lachnospiraceae bacterium]
MLKLFLSSHGTLASGMKRSVELLSGKKNQLTVFDAYVDEKRLEDALDDFFACCKEEDQKMLLSDLYGGSVNQKMSLYLDHPDTCLVAGVNLALVLELSLREKISETEIEGLIEESRSMLRMVRMSEVEAGSDEDFL